jgi:hypothetical protein
MIEETDGAIDRVKGVFNSLKVFFENAVQTPVEIY